MSMLVLIAVPVLLAVYYLALLASKPKLPKPGAIVVRYDPPVGLTPAAARYVWKGCVDQRTVACVLAGLATKGRIALQHSPGGYKITKTVPPANASPLNDEEQSTMEWLFSNFLDQAQFNPAHDCNGCIMSLRGLLDRRLRNGYQSARTGWAVLGMAASFPVSMLLALHAGDQHALTLKFAATFFLTVLLTGLVVALLLVPAVADLLRGIGSIGRVTLAIAISGFALAGSVAIFLQLSRFAPMELALLILVLVGMNIAAVPLLRVMTPLGVEAQGHIAGFREYLREVEQDQLDRLVKTGSPPPASAAMLSYAIALEVKEAWGDELANACFAG